MAQRRLWTHEEDRIISELVNIHGCKRWTQIAQEMNDNKFNITRSSKQIRERWYNHLDPQINKRQWSLEEEEIIFEAHKRYGSKWKQIGKMLSYRTDNSIKNHFYSTLRRSLRRINKFLGFKNSTSQMRVLKPSILSYLIQSSTQQSKLLVERMFRFATFKPCKNTIKPQQNAVISEKEKNIFEKAISKLIKINDQYENKKQQNRKIKKNGRKICKQNIISENGKIQQISKTSMATLDLNDQQNSIMNLEQSIAAEDNSACWGQPLANRNIWSNQNKQSYQLKLLWSSNQQEGKFFSNMDEERKNEIWVRLPGKNNDEEEEEQEEEKYQHQRSKQQKQCLINESIFNNTIINNQNQNNYIYF